MLYEVITGLAHATLQAAQRSAGSAQVPTVCHQVLAHGACTFVAEAQCQDVARQAVELKNARTMPFTDISQITQLLGRIDKTRGGQDAKGMELREIGIFVRLVGKPCDSYNFV